MQLTDRGRRILLTGLAVTGYVLLALVLLGRGIEGAGGLGGIDAIAYWTAAGHVLRGEPLYGIESFELAAYQYPPPFAQLLAPAALLPMPAFVWLWRVVELVGLRLATGSWIRGGVAILVFPPIIAEIDAGNVHLIIAGVVALAMRRQASPIAPAFLLKMATWPLTALAWTTDRRGLLLGVAGAAAVVGLSVVLARDTWLDFLGFMTSGRIPTGWYNVLADVPVPARLAVAAALGLAATRWVRLAPIAVTLAYPVVWISGLSTLIAIVAPIAQPPPGVVRGLGHPDAPVADAAGTR